MCKFWFQYFCIFYDIGTLVVCIDLLGTCFHYGQCDTDSRGWIVRILSSLFKHRPQNISTWIQIVRKTYVQLVISIIHKCLEIQKSQKSNSRIPCALDQGSHLYMSDMCPKWGYICQTVFYLTPTQLMQCQTFYRQHFLTLAFQTCPLRWKLFCNSGFHTAAVGRMFISLWHFTWKHISTDFENSQQGIQIFQWNSFCGNFSNWVNIPH